MKPGNSIKMNRKIMPTGNIELFCQSMEALTLQRTFMIAVVIGDSGIGKTRAIHYFRNIYLKQPRHTLLPACIDISIPVRPTPRLLISRILKTLEESPGRDGQKKTPTGVIQALQRNRVKLVMIDQAESLNQKSIEMLLEIQAGSQCYLALVGGPSLKKITDRYLDRNCHTITDLPFSEPDLDDVVGLILPNLTLPNWTFDPDDSADRELGEYIWSKVRPSLRKLRMLLQVSQVMAKDERITQELVDRAIKRFAETFR